ncbi:MAG: mobilization protein [Prolixibacteraceae bacterium]|jgi:hypothetical protein|nr:mobilization protein [Prolixibacteraceae bacterium]MBT6004312.1 mobilization protein [Prolixibacteraceae bacterium]MBT6765103.1 mobilization protein [Prolixibacteraceae bacterium]MBT6999876.1 mobilization protein [Prolixibacteraceae bacterium]MBT7396571.1 mobilization protein [Prolixibacteraceae bacterium]
MNCLQAKKISIIGYLASVGINPEKVKNGAAWYNSPFRTESTPSFKVDRNLNLWYDFGIGTGGNVLNLVMNLNSTDVAGALLVLQKPEYSKITFSFSEQQKPELSNIQIKHTQPLQNRALLQYLASRGISQFKAVNFVSEAYYQVNRKQYFSLAFKNDCGGYELRNKYFKGSTSPKAITTIKGSPESVNIFEGWIDFLSALEYYKTSKPASTCIILNSTNNLDTVIGTLQNYRQINLFLDNDPTGELATEKIKSIHPNTKDYSKIIYKNHNDFNQYLLTI